MISAQAAIQRARRDLVLGFCLKLLLGVGLAFCLVIGPAQARLALLAIIVVVWFAFQLTSARISQLAAMSPPLIAAGQFEEAERQIEQAMRAFSIFRVVKIQALQCLAQLRHAQRQWQESALLCRAVLGQRSRHWTSLAKPCRLLLADALLEMNELNGAWDAISGLYKQRLSLQEAINLLLVQLDYSSRIGAWGPMVDQIATKAQLAELMPPKQCARAQGLLALAARQSGRNDWAQWLAARVELIADVQQLCEERPLLKAIWNPA